MSEKIQLIDINKSYKGDHIETQALTDINLTFDKQDFTAIVGPSGSGKSTLLSLIGTLDKPTSGQILYNEIDILTLKRNELADFRFMKIGFVFQQFHLLPTLSAFENVMSPFYGRGPSKKYKERVLFLLDQLGLYDKYNSLPSQLSGGEQQRVAIARSLANQPEWLLADEPTGNLDSQNTINLYNVLNELRNKLEFGIIMVTHDLNLAHRADRFITIQDGQIIPNNEDKTGVVLC
ncbi:Lipoprotein-releasing system ATP-binding protein LolD [compost metagenome]